MLTSAPVFKVAEMTARAEQAEKAQTTLAAIFKISEGKATVSDRSYESACHVHLRQECLVTKRIAGLGSLSAALPYKCFR